MRRQIICLIEDDALVRDALAFVLRDNDFDLLIASEAGEGLRLAMADDVDAVVTDISLPGCDGFAMIAAIRAHRQTLPILAMTGGGERDGLSFATLARRAGADICLAKPFRAGELLRVLRASIAAPSIAQLH